METKVKYGSKYPDVKCRQCGNELSDEAIEVEMDLCPECGGLIEGEKEMEKEILFNTDKSKDSTTRLRK